MLNILKSSRLLLFPMVTLDRIQTHSHTDTHTDTLTHRHTQRERYTLTHRDTERETHTHTQTHA